MTAEILLQILLLVIGFALLIKGGDFLVDSASNIARYFGITELVIGLTIVAFGTSAPELMINLVSSFNGINEFVFGNVIGSNIINILLGIGLVGTYKRISVNSSTVRFEIPFLIAITIILSVMINDQFFFEGNDHLSREDSIILLILFLLFIYYAFDQTRKEKIVIEEHEKPDKLWKEFLFFVLGILLLWFGSDLTVSNAEKLGYAAGIPKDIIAIFVLAVGTSLPEIVVSVSAAKKASSDMAVGNIIGSNLFNILLVLGISGLVNPTSYDAVSFNFDLLIMNIVTVFLLVIVMYKDKSVIRRRESSILIIIFALYCIYRIILT